MSALATFLAVVGLVLIHVYIAGRLRRYLSGIPRSRLLSFAGGVPVAFVFFQILPTLAQDQQTLAQAARGILGFLNKHVYIVAFAGFATFYTVERVVKQSMRRQREAGKGHQTSDAAFWFAITTFSVMNAIIGYLLAEVERDLTTLALFFFAFALKFIVNDFALHENHKDRYDHLGRWIVTAAILVGWTLGYLATVPQVGLAMLRAFLMGGVILTIMREELPEERQSTVWPFVLSGALYGALLITL